MIKQIFFWFILSILILVSLLVISELALAGYVKFINLKSKLNLDSYKLKGRAANLEGVGEKVFLEMDRNRDGFFKNNDYLYRPSALFGYEYEPNLGKINSFGLVGKEYQLKKDKDTYRILLLGDSIAATDLERTILEERLNSSFLSQSGRNFEIWNAAVPSWGVKKYALFLKYKGIKYHPDMVLIFFCLNDVGLDEGIVIYRTKNGLTSYNFPNSGFTKIMPINPLLLRRSYLYRLVVFSIEGYLGNGGRPKSRKEKIYEYFKMISDICKKKDIALVGVIYPLVIRNNQYSRADLRSHGLLLDFTKDSNWKIIDLHDYLSESERVSYQGEPGDEIHFNPQGKRRIAEIVFNYLLENKKQLID